MTNSLYAQNVYKTAQRELTSSKGIELKVFTAVTSSLKNVDLNATDKASKLAEAVVENAKLWRIMFMDLVNPENTLPQQLKEQLISLAEFTQAHTFKVLAGDADHQVLIDINESIISGLRQSMKLGGVDNNNQIEAA